MSAANLPISCGILESVFGNGRLEGQELLVLPPTASISTVNLDRFKKLSVRKLAQVFTQFRRGERKYKDCKVYHYSALKNVTIKIADIHNMHYY